MKENHFQQRLRKEILRYSGVLITIISCVLVAIFIVFNRVSIDMLSIALIKSLNNKRKINESKLT